MKTKAGETVLVYFYQQSVFINLLLWKCHTVYYSLIMSRSVNKSMALLLRCSLNSLNYCPTQLTRL